MTTDERFCPLCGGDMNPWNEEYCDMCEIEQEENEEDWE